MILPGPGEPKSGLGRALREINAVGKEGPLSFE